MTSIYFVPLFDQKEIPTESKWKVVFGFLTYQDYSELYSQISIFTNYQILILEDFFSKPIQNPLLASLFLLHLSFENIVIWKNGKVLKEKIEDVTGPFGPIGELRSPTTLQSKVSSFPQVEDLLEKLTDSFLGNRTIYGILKEDVEMELEGYSLIEKRIIESKMGKLDLKNVIEIYDSDDLKSFFEKYEIKVQNVGQMNLWKEKNLFRHYLYHLILEKRIHIYPFDQKENIISFVKEQNILHTYF